MLIRHLVLIIGLFIVPNFGIAQTYEFGGFIGGTNYIGDVGDTQYINPNQLVLGGIFKWNRSRRHSFRASANFGKIIGNDLDSSDPRRIDRGYSFENNIKEVSLGLEFTFWEYNPHSGQPIHTPYLYTGITYFLYDYLRVINNNNQYQLEKVGKKTAFAIPIVLGYKASLGSAVNLGFEIGARYTFTDNLDGSDYKNRNGIRSTFGNLNSNDWYVFSGITLTFAFGRAPCNSKF